MNAANLLKPMLARGELRLIGATTLDEYRQYIEKGACMSLSTCGDPGFAAMAVVEQSCTSCLMICLL